MLSCISPSACTFLEKQEAGIDFQQQWRDPCFTSWCRRFPFARCETQKCTARFFVGSTDVTDHCNVGKFAWGIVQFAPKCSKTAGTNLFRAVKCHFLHCLALFCSPVSVQNIKRETSFHCWQTMQGLCANIFVMKIFFLLCMQTTVLWRMVQT